jgi:hypothetical protein
VFVIRASGPNISAKQIIGLFDFMEMKAKLN